MLSLHDGQPVQYLQTKSHFRWYCNLSELLRYRKNIYNSTSFASPLGRSNHALILVYAFADVPMSDSNLLRQAWHYNTEDRDELWEFLPLEHNLFLIHKHP